MLTAFCADELRWRPIELQSIEDVGKLNALFDDGWRIEPIAIDGLPFLAFCGRQGEYEYPARAATLTNRLLLILQRSVPGERKQRAVFAERAASGYIEWTGHSGAKSKTVA